VSLLFATATPGSLGEYFLSFFFPPPLRDVLDVVDPCFRAG